MSRQIASFPAADSLLVSCRVQTLRMGILVLALLGLSAALVCPDGGMCEDKNTCCKDAVGAYGCCPLPHVSNPVEFMRRLEIFEQVTSRSSNFLYVSAN